MPVHIVNGCYGTSFSEPVLREAIETDRQRDQLIRCPVNGLTEGKGMMRIVLQGTIRLMHGGISHIMHWWYHDRKEYEKERTMVHALETAAANGAASVDRFYKRRGDISVPFTAKALGLACRYSGYDTVERLLSHGATFDPPNSRFADEYRMEPFHLMLLPGYVSKTRRKGKTVISHEERLRVLDLLIEHDLVDLGDLLYMAILTYDFEMMRELLKRGAVLSEKYTHLVSGDLGYSTDSAENENERFSTSERKFFQTAIQGLSDEDLLEVLDIFTSMPGIEKVRLFDSDVYYSYYTEDSGGYAKEKKPVARMVRADILPVLFEKTTLPEVLRHQDAVDAMIEQNSADGLQFLIDHGFVNRQSDITHMMDKLEETAPDKPELKAVAVRHRAANPVKETLNMPSDPLAASNVRHSWRYSPCNNGSDIILLHYKGESDEVAIPPRVSRRPVTQISEKVFGGNESRRTFTKVWFPGSISRIPDCLGARYGDKADAKEIVLEEGIEFLGEGAFSNTSIRSIKIPDSVVSIGSGAFSHCSQLESAQLPSNTKELPSSIFLHCASLSKIAGLESVERLGSYALCGTRLTSANLGALTVMEPFAMAACTHLSEAHLSEELTELPWAAFRKTTSLKQMPSLPNLQRIGKDAFAQSGLTQIHLGASVTELGEGAFSDCHDLTSAVIEAPHCDIPERLFAECLDLMELKLLGPWSPETAPSQPTERLSIGTAAFKFTPNLHSFWFPPNLTKIGEQAFAWSGLREARLPAAEIGMKSFEFCNTLAAVSIANGAVLRQGVFGHCKILAQVRLPGDLERIPPDAFRECTSLQNITIPDSVESIGPCAFEGAGLTRIRIPESVNHIEERAFAGCSKLADVVFEGSPEFVADDAFAETPVYGHSESDSHSAP